MDHILPRKHGGKDDLTNLQALCFKCNANKGARDDEILEPFVRGLMRGKRTVFFARASNRSYHSLEHPCGCHSRQVSGDAAHTLVMPKRHAAIRTRTGLSDADILLAAKPCSFLTRPGAGDPSARPSAARGSGGRTRRSSSFAQALSCGA